MNQQPLGPPILAEDLLLLLIEPNFGRFLGTGAFAGESLLSYTLTGAVLVELALGEHVQTDSAATRVGAVLANPPSDALLRIIWEYVADKPRNVQAVIAGTRKLLLGPMLDRLVARGEIRRNRRKTLGLFAISVFEDGGSGRRAALVNEVRWVLERGAEPKPRLAALTAFLSGSGTLPQFHPEIAWSSSVIARAQEIENGTWGGGGGAEAIARAVIAKYPGWSQREEGGRGGIYL